MENKNKNNFRVVIISVTMMHWKKVTPAALRTAVCTTMFLTTFNTLVTFGAILPCSFSSF